MSETHDRLLDEYLVQSMTSPEFWRMVKRAQEMHQAGYVQSAALKMQAALMAAQNHADNKLHFGEFGNYVGDNGECKGWMDDKPSPHAGMFRFPDLAHEFAFGRLMQAAH